MTANLHSTLALRVAGLLDAGISASAIRAEHPLPPDDPQGAEAWILSVLDGAGCNVQELASPDAYRRERLNGVLIINQRADRYIIAFLDTAKEAIGFELISESGSEIITRSYVDDLVNDNPDLRAWLVTKEEFDELSPYSTYEKHWFFSSLVKNRRYLIQAGLASLLTNLFALTVSLFSLVVYNKIIPAQAMSSLAVLVVGVTIVLFMDYLVKVSRSKLLGIAGVDADLAIADKLFSRIVEAKYDTNRGSVGAIANTLKEYEQVREFLTSATVVAFFDAPFALLFLFVIWAVGGWMVVPVFLGVAILLVTALVLQPKLKRLAETGFEDGQSKHSVMVETLTGLETIKLLGAGGVMRSRFRRVLGRQVIIGEETKGYTHLATNFGQEIQQGVQVSVVAVGALSVTSGSAAFGAIIACTILSGKALVPFIQLSQMLLRINQVRTGYEALNKFMAKPLERDSENGYLSRGRLTGKIEVQDLNFSYEGQEKEALSGVSFSISPGEKVAIVGRVGSGKSTLGKLLSRLYDAKTGKVLISGIDIKQIDPSELRENIGYVSQEPWLIAGSIEENITLGNPYISSGDVLWAAKISGVSSFVDKNPQGYKVQVRERGEGLSGGQKQCVAVARAIVRKPPILILDEPTSSMDARTEKSFLEAFSKHDSGSTLIIITHRTSLISMVDKVFVMDDGKLVGSGPASQFLGKQSQTQSVERLES